MQLTRLDVKGFKSFGDKITIHFNEGVTAIVGPNGCGKSNVVDSIRWVLGEQSTRMLRSEKMENIIFNGTKNRKPANLAEVSLTFDNTKNILPTEFSQVTVTRKLYRTGESEYRLNDVQCRLKDITDLFLDTGIGADSYAIIELKMIDEIITNKEGSRRNLFEEASGISKYKLRKKQTHNKLKDAEADLERVEDLLFEIEKNLKTLENQAKKAERYYRLKEQYKTAGLALASFRIASFSDSLISIELQEQKQENERLDITAKISTLEAALEQQKLESVTREKNLSFQQKTTNEYVGKIRAYESEKKLKNEQLKFQKERENRLSVELEKDKDQLNHVLYNLKRLKTNIQQEDDTLQSLQHRLSDLKTVVDGLHAEQAVWRTTLNEATAINNQLQGEVLKAEKASDILKIQQQALEQESLRNTEDAGNREMELHHFNQLISELEYSIAADQNNYQLAVDTENNVQQQIAATERQLADVKESITQHARLQDSRQNEYNLTKSLVDNLEGFPESIRFLKKNADWLKNVPLFSDILFCQDEYRVAIENYLEPLMNHFVVDDHHSAFKAVDLLVRHNKGRAQFIILSHYTITTQLLKEQLNPELIPALRVVEVDARYQPLCNHLLSNVYLANDTTDSHLSNLLLRTNTVLLDQSGRINKSAANISGGSIGLFDGKRIGRTQNLEKLSKELKTMQDKFAELKDRQLQLQSALQTLKISVNNDGLQQRQQQLNRLQTELITAKTRREQYQAFISNSHNRKQDIAVKIKVLQDEESALFPLLAGLRTKKQTQSDLLTENQQAYQQLNEQITSQSNIYNQENIQYHQQINKVLALKKDLEYRERQQENLQNRITTGAIESNKIQDILSEILRQTDISDDELLDMYNQRDALEAATQQAEQDYYTWRGHISLTEQEISLLRRKKEQTDVVYQELKDKRNTLKIELNALKERLSLEFNIDIKDMPETNTPADSDETTLSERAAKLKKQLDDFGTINPMAFDAYQEMNGRYQFIQSQKADLTEAKVSLLSTIQEIDDKAREKFMSAFTAVRDNFIAVFRSLFNKEDSCDLILADPDHPLESDIDIIAKPKGKRPLSINQLSGGEKTLTATAILFSLYLLRPAPFCIFDEVDAPLDDTNIDKFNHIIRAFSGSSQFIVVSHNKKTIASTDIVYGVTMVEQGISRVVPVDLRQMAS